MKLYLSILLAAVVAVSAAENVDNYEDSGYFDADGNWVQSSEFEEYDEEYYENYDAEYVENMNEDNGNFQYYDADGQYDESYSVAGYYDEYGQFVQYNVDNDEEQVDEQAAQDYYQEWQQNGGANGYYDNDGDWVQNKYELVPCASYMNQGYDAENNQQNGQYNAAWAQNNYNQNNAVANWDDYMDGCEDSMRIRTNNCKSSVVEVKNVTIYCDSPYRTYFGNGHMASELCEYGDRAMIIVFFEVLENLDYMKNIYMTLGVYAGKQEKELLWAVRSVELCNTFVGHSCTTKGNYAFAFQATFDYGQMSDRNLFVPMVEMGFSTRADEGYNLGGVNIDCKFNSFYKQYDPWYNGKSAHASQVWGAGGLGGLGGKFGLLIGALLLGGAVGLYFHSRQKEGIEFQGNSDELVDQEA